MAKLVVREGRDVGAEYVFPPDKRRIVLGRRSANEIQVLDPQASREHTAVIVDGGRYILRDLKSRNGTHLNDEPVTADEEIEFGDRIRIGAAVYELVDETKEEPITLQIPGYEIIERIGQGGMGTVYKSRQLSMDRVVALKVLNDRYSKDTKFIERFIREARAAGRLSHPNVIHVHDVSESDGTHYFTMEYVDGTTVKRLLKKKGRLGVDKALDIVLQAAKSLEYAHENSIIHRDIKPDNLMITKDGVVKLADLGIAKTFDEAGDESAKQRRVFGTPHYMAPEQALGKDIDARADIYSLGATFYHMLTGATPFQGPTVTDVLKAHIQASLPPVQEKASDVPDSVVFILERMMAKTAEKRYASMNSLIDDVEKVVADREADIERLDAGESSVMPAVKGAPGKKRERKRRGPSEPMPAWKKGLIGAGVVAGLAALFGATIFVTGSLFARGVTPEGLLDRIYLARDEGRNEDLRALADEFLDLFPDDREADEVRGLRRDAGGEEGDDLAAELERIEKLAEDDLPGALAPAEEFLERSPPEPLAERARALVERARAAVKKQRAESAADKLKEAERFAAGNPDDHAGQARRFRAVADEYEDTPSGREAARLARAASDRLVEAEGEVVKRSLEEARRSAADARDEGNYDDAIGAYRTFLDRHGSTAAAEEARDGVTRLESEIKKLFEDTKRQAERQLKNGIFGQAIATVGRFTKTYVSARWTGEAEKLAESVNGQVEATFEKESKRASGAALNFRYDDALGQFNVLGSRFRGTRWADFVRTRSTQLEAEKLLHSEIIRRVNAAGPTELPFVPPGVPESMEAMKWQVLGATEREVTLFPGREKDLQRPVKWGQFDPDRLLTLIELYAPQPTRAQYMAMAYLCQERGLDARADEYLAKAASAQN
ncbi:MAG: protein kinase domain-containing protein [Planctomycetota bacterium]